MKKFVIKIGLMIILIAALWGVLWVSIYSYCRMKAEGHRDHGPVWISHNINPSLQKKRLEQCQEPKVVILGGSNAGFGICSPMLEDHYKKPVFNTGTNASVGLRMQLAMFEDYLNVSDIVIILPEYHQFSKDFWGSLILCHVLTTDDDFVHKLSLYQAFRLTPYWKEWIRLAKEKHDPDFGSSLCYSSVALNLYGDIELQREHKKFDSFWDGGFGDLDPSSFQYLDEFISRCKATTILMPPVLNETSYQCLRNLIGEINSNLESIGHPFAVNTERYRWPDSLFYDTGYHLTSSSAERRTHMLIQDVDSILMKHNGK